MTPVAQGEPARDRGERLGDREFALTRDDFADLAGILQAEAGIVLERSKAPLVYSRLSRRLRALGLASFRQYRAHIATRAGAGERRLMVEALTTNVTRFFREAHHFDHLRASVLPALLDGAQRGRRVRLWSAGCSSGEEPYSIALTVLSLLPDAARHDIRILATDIDRHVLEEGAKGRYSRAALSKAPAVLRERWMHPCALDDGSEGWEVGAELKSLVTFRQANLVGHWPMKGPFQVIFCRNVVIYFDELTRAEVLTRLTGLVELGGHLYIGHSERADASACGLDFAALSTYRRIDPASRAREQP
jgi:chemotaxis protein methyltransferase CheR